MKRTHANEDPFVHIGPIGANSKKPRIIGPTSQSGGSIFRRTRRGAKSVGKATAGAAVSRALGPAGSALVAASGDRFKKREDGKLPPAVRSMLAKQGDTVITSLAVTRTPLDMVTNAALNMVTFGAFNKAVERSGYDKAFHLALVINDKFTLDKQEVIKLSSTIPRGKTTERKTVPLLKQGVTIRELLGKTRGKMGDAKFTGYDARSNNCQDFIIAILEGNGLMPSDQETRDFIKQDASAIFKKLPKGTAKIARAVTDLAAKANRFVSGEGKKRGDKRDKIPEHGMKFRSPFEKESTAPSGSFATTS